MTKINIFKTFYEIIYKEDEEVPNSKERRVAKNVLTLVLIILGIIFFYLTYNNWGTNRSIFSAIIGIILLLLIVWVRKGRSDFFEMIS